MPLWLLACREGSDDATREVEISPSELYRVFAEDSAGAMERFAGADLVITGQPQSVFVGGAPGSQPAVIFKADPRGIVSCGGESLVHVLPEAGSGARLTVECPSATARFWPAPNESLELSDCSPRSTGPPRES